MISPSVRTLIVEDEPLARRALRSLIDDTAWLECVGEVDTGTRAVEAIEAERPELIFLDVELPGMSGIEVVRRAGTDALVIFTTAFDDYALVAFELGAIDYLRKPFGRDRMNRALCRVVPQLEAYRAGRTGHATSPPLQDRLDLAASVRPIETLFIRDGGRVVPVPVGEIVRLEADGDFVAVFARGHRHLLYVNLRDLAAQLDRRAFLRIHRSHVVNLGAVTSVVSVDPNRAEVRLVDGSRVIASRSGTRVLRQRMRRS